MLWPGSELNIESDWPKADAVDNIFMEKGGISNQEFLPKSKPKFQSV